MFLFLERPFLWNISTHTHTHIYLKTIHIVCCCCYAAPLNGIVLFILRCQCFFFHVTIVFCYAHIPVFKLILSRLLSCFHNWLTFTREHAHTYSLRKCCLIVISDHLTNNKCVILAHSSQFINYILYIHNVYTHFYLLRCDTMAMGSSTICCAVLCVCVPCHSFAFVCIFN